MFLSSGVKSFGMMVARDGVEPPTPAFSGIYNDLTGLRWLRKYFKGRERHAYLGLESWAGSGIAVDVMLPQILSSQTSASDNSR